MAYSEGTISPFILLSPRPFLFVSGVWPLCPRADVAAHQKVRGLSSGLDNWNRYTIPGPPVLAESARLSLSAGSVCPPDVGLTLMAVGIFDPIAKKIP